MMFEANPIMPVIQNNTSQKHLACLLALRARKRKRFNVRTREEIQLSESDQRAISFSGACSQANVRWDTLSLAWFLSANDQSQREQKSASIILKPATTSAFGWQKSDVGRSLGTKRKWNQVILSDCADFAEDPGPFSPNLPRKPRPLVGGFACIERKQLIPKQLSV